MIEAEVITCPLDPRRALLEVEWSSAADDRKVRGAIEGAMDGLMDRLVDLGVVDPAVGVTLPKMVARG